MKNVPDHRGRLRWPSRYADLVKSALIQRWEEMARSRFVLAALLLIPALLFVPANFLRYEAGHPFLADVLDRVLWPEAAWLQVLRDVLVMFGPVLAVALSGLSVLRVKLGRELGRLVGTVTLDLRWGYLAMLAMGAMLVAVLGAYFVVENWECLTGRQVIC